MKNLQWEFDTEQEAAYAYNVAEVILAIGENRVIEELNEELVLTQQQIIHVETKVCKTLRKEMRLPKDYKFPRIIKNILSKTYTIK